MVTKKMKCVIIAAALFAISICLSACNAGFSDGKTAEGEYISPSKLPEEAVRDLTFLEDYVERNVYGPIYGFIYVEDENGNPVENLRCYNEGDWYYEGMEGAGKGSTYSFPGGIIPAPLRPEDEKAPLTIVNEEAETFLHENIEVDREKLLSGEIYRLVWKHESPAESALKSGEYIKLNVSTDLEYDISRFTVHVTEYYEQPKTEFNPNAEINPAIEPNFGKVVRAEALAEIKPLIGSMEKVKLYFIGNDGTVMIKTEDFPETEMIKFTIIDMDSHIIAVTKVMQWEFPFENGKTEYSVNLR